MKLVPSLAVIIFTAYAFSQTAERYEVARLLLVGNRSLKEEQLLAVMQTRETPSAFWKFIYNNISETVGEKPEYYDPIVFAADYARLKRLYENYGFFHARIDTSLTFRSEEKEVEITIRITEGKRSLIDTVQYKGLESLPPEVQRDIFNEPLLRASEPYILENVENELRRIVSLLANSGYVNAKVEKVEAKRFASTNNFTVLYVFNPGARYRFGAISVVYDTASAERVNEKVILRHIDFAEGEYYSEEKKMQSERNLTRLGVFDACKIENIVSDDMTTNLLLPVRITVRTRSFQELAPEVGVNDENNAFNVSVGIGYNHRNFFGGAQNFSTTLRASIQSIQNFSVRKFFSKAGMKDSSLVARVDFNMQLVQPYFINNRTSIRSSFSAIIDKQHSYYLPVFRWQTGTTTQAATFTKIFVDWNLEFSNPTALATQADTIIGTYQRQLNSILTFTIQRDKRNDIFYPSKGFFHSFSLEEAGTLPRVVGPALRSTLPYSQYIKTSVLGQWYWDATRTNKFIWAVKARTGMAFLYGHRGIDVPLTQRFFAGGSGSLRGWKARTLGAVVQKDLGGNAIFEGSVEGRWNPLKEAGTFWFLDLSKFSFVAFYDVGNIWSKPQLMRLSQCAMDIGIGIRYNTVAGPVRIDFGMRFYDPEAEPHRRWIHQRIFFKETVAGGVFHLGVGHTF